MTARLRQTARLAPGLIGAWGLATFLAALIADVRVQAEPLGVTALRSAAIGLLIGTAAAWLETGPLARWGRRLPLWAALSARTVSYAAVVALALAAMIAAISWVRARTGLWAALQTDEFRAVASSGAFWVFLGLLMAASFIINFVLQLRRVLGPETLRALFLGTYRRPRHEERAFAFLDLTDSTVWAERLGPLAFTDFKNDFFADVAEPVLATGGRIVQYVGDEVMVAWPMTRAEHDAAPLRFFFLVEARVAARADRYRARYGAVPAFKCGVHGGTVVTAEVGDLKRDIVHSGDVVNTAARIEGECRPRGHTLLVSDSLIARMPARAEMTQTALGPAALRGKSQSVGLVSVTRAEPGGPEG